MQWLGRGQSMSIKGTLSFPLLDQHRDQKRRLIICFLRSTVRTECQHWRCNDDTKASVKQSCWVRGGIVAAPEIRVAKRIHHISISQTKKHGSYMIHDTCMFQTVVSMLNCWNLLISPEHWSRSHWPWSIINYRNALASALGLKSVQALNWKGNEQKPIRRQGQLL